MSKGESYNFECISQIFTQTLPIPKNHNLHYAYYPSSVVHNNIVFIITTIKDRFAKYVPISSEYFGWKADTGSLSVT